MFNKKMKADDTIDKYKARLEIKGFRQQAGLYYFDTYSMRITLVKMILAIVALRNGEVHQMNVKMTFLNGDLEKVLYINQPEGFMAPGLESKVYIQLLSNDRVMQIWILTCKNRDPLERTQVCQVRLYNSFNVGPWETDDESVLREAIDDEVVQDQRQRDDNDLQDERQYQPKEEEVEPRRSKRARIEKSFGPDFVSFLVENEPTSYREAVTSSEWLNGKKPLKVK
ncbi:alpha-glucan water dikinase, chloroplastic-like protein [Tanacetum coccineum]